MILLPNDVWRSCCIIFLISLDCRDRRDIFLDYVISLAVKSYIFSLFVTLYGLHALRRILLVCTSEADCSCIIIDGCIICILVLKAYLNSQQVIDHLNLIFNSFKE